MINNTLFRGKNLKGQWVEGSLFNGINYFDNEKATFILYNDPKIDSRGCTVNYSGEPVDPETVSQWTGLTDKNGVKIFGGDILGFMDSWGEERISGVVEYGVFNCSCCDGVYGWQIKGGDIRDLEGNTWLYVKGNIWDNPELVGEKL